MLLGVQLCETAERWHQREDASVSSQKHQGCSSRGFGLFLKRGNSAVTEKCKSANTDIFDKCEQNSPFLIKPLFSFDNVIDYQAMQNETIISWWHYFPWNQKGYLWNFITCKVTKFLFKMKFKNKIQFYNLLKREFSWKLFCNLTPLILGQGNKNCQKHGVFLWAHMACPSASPERRQALMTPKCTSDQGQDLVPWTNLVSAPENEDMAWSWWETVHSQQITAPNTMEKDVGVGWKLFLKIIFVYWVFQAIIDQSYQIPFALIVDVNSTHSVPFW